MIEAKGFRIFEVSEILGIRLRNQGGDLGRTIQGSGTVNEIFGYAIQGPGLAPLYGIVRFDIRVFYDSGFTASRVHEI